ncbi:MAG: RNA-binding S4 domain-containing protein [Opitutae bacterium]|nr:RNA-binding S4 domain-containing protein [Opitutae bacterium]
MSSPDQPAPANSAARLDKWLWAVRIFKSRSLAADACRSGSVQVNALPAKPSREVHAGEIVTVRQGLVLRTLAVLAVPRSRVGAKLVPTYCEERTTPEEWAKAQVSRVEQFLAREKGSGRPTKRDRRLIDQLLS